MQETPEQTIERVKAKGREMQQQYEKVMRMQRSNCVLIGSVNILVHFFLGGVPVGHQATEYMAS